MSLLQANTLYTTADWPRLSDATSLPPAAVFEDSEDSSSPQIYSRTQVSVLTLEPTARAPGQPAKVDQGAPSVTHLQDSKGRARYRVMDLASASPIREPEELDLDTPVFSLKPRSTITVRAKVTVRHARLSLIVPDGLAEGE